jgi:hypothetical protein
MDINRVSTGNGTGSMSHAGRSRGFPIVPVSFGCTSP